MKQCVICDKMIESEDAPILAMSGYGNPKLLCDECAEDIEIVTSERDCDKIAEAMARRNYSDDLIEKVFWKNNFEFIKAIFK